MTFTFDNSHSTVWMKAAPALIMAEYATMIPDQYTRTDGRTDSPQLSCHSRPQAEQFPFFTAEDYLQGRMWEESKRTASSSCGRTLAIEYWEMCTMGNKCSSTAGRWRLIERERKTKGETNNESQKTLYYQGHSIKCPCPSLIYPNGCFVAFSLYLMFWACQYSSVICTVN